jgi:hypothetical protein
MVAFEDLLYLFIACLTFLIAVVFTVQYFERRHKTDLDFEKRRLEADADNVLMKAKIYADKDIRVATLENQILQGIEAPYALQTGTELDQYMPLLNTVLQNPEMLDGILSKIGYKKG